MKERRWTRFPKLLRIFLSYYLSIFPRMKRKQTIKAVIAIVLVVIVAFVVRYCWVSFPVISGYGAKMLCSSIFVAGRNLEMTRQQELGFSSLNLATYKINYKDSSVTCSVFGFAERKAIYRRGLGATLVVEIPEEKIRAQQYRLPVTPVVNTAEIPWPAGDKIIDSFPSNINREALLKAVEAGFTENDSTHLVRTRAVIVLYDGKLVAEKYADGFNKNSRLIGWSMTKTITGALIGMLAAQGKLKIDGPAPVKEWADIKDPRHNISIKDLLQQSSGLDFLEDYSKYSDATRMLFMRADMGTYTANRPLNVKPGTFFSYTSGNTNLLSRIMRSAIGEKDYHAFPYEQLFYKLGMYSAIMEPDAAGNLVGSSYSYATARDWARFGLMYLDSGRFNGQQILPAEWVKASVVPAPSAKIGQYGYQLWLNRGSKADASTRVYPQVPPDMFYADGFEGQNIFIIPSEKLVVVRLGLTQKGAYDVDGFLSKIISSCH
jgi:CubicO group peptidase (beta-lactamase class C family)